MRSAYPMRYQKASLVTMNCPWTMRDVLKTVLRNLSLLSGKCRKYLCRNFSRNRSVTVIKGPFFHSYFSGRLSSQNLKTLNLESSCSRPLSLFVHFSICRQLTGYMPSTEHWMLSLDNQRRGNDLPLFPWGMLWRILLWSLDLLCRQYFYRACMLIYFEIRRWLRQEWFRQQKYCSM